MSIISALPYNLTNGATADATQVMADFNQIYNNVNANAVPTSGGSLSTTTITGSIVDSTPIGNTTPSTGKFTSLLASTTMGVTGAATFGSTLGVTGATTLSSTLGVTGLSTLTGGATLGNLLTQATPVTVASASTVDLGAQTSNIIDISGTTTITSFGSTAVAGQEFDVRFTGALTLTYNATSLILPTAASITTAANDTARVRALGSSNFIVLNYQRASGLALVSPTSAFATLMTPFVTTLTGTGQSGSQNHGLGAVPTYTRLMLRLIAGSDANYSVNDETDPCHDASNFDTTHWANATQVGFITGASGVRVVNKTTGAQFTISTYSNWAVVVYAAK